MDDDGDCPGFLARMTASGMPPIYIKLDLILVIVEI